MVMDITATEAAAGAHCLASKRHVEEKTAEDRTPISGHRKFGLCFKGTFFESRSSHLVPNFFIVFL
jgi:hypothetical protein